MGAAFFPKGGVLSKLFEKGFTKNFFMIFSCACMKKGRTRKDAAFFCFPYMGSFLVDRALGQQGWHKNQCCHQRAGQ